MAFDGTNKKFFFFFFCVFSFLFQLPSISTLLRHLETSDFYGHVLCALRERLNAFYDKVKGDVEFADRGSLERLEAVLAQTCAALDPFAFAFTTSHEDAMFR